MKKFPIKLDHLLEMTDKVGLVEHATGKIPNISEGYSVDDNARAIQVCNRLKNKFKALKQMLPVYLKFVNSARRLGGFALDLENDGKWKEDYLLNEHFGRAISALAESGQDVDNYWGYLVKLKDPRNWAQAIGASRFAGKNYQKIAIELADRLISIYAQNSSKDWQWFESEMTYDNGRLPMGLLWAYHLTRRNSYLNVALTTLDFFISLCWQEKKACFSFPGNKGWFGKSGVRAHYDQQPVEAGNMVESCVLAYEITKDDKYFDYAQKAMEWYFGRNIEKAVMYIKDNGGVCDGFGKDSINTNQGAEATLSYLLAWEALSRR